MKKNAKKLRGYSAADMFLWLLLLLCIAGIGIRIAVGDRSMLTKGIPGEYLISYVATDLHSEYSDYFSEGMEYYLEDGTPFGSLTGDAVFTPTREYLEDENGQYVASYSSSGRVDVKGSAKVEGVMTERGFLLGNQMYLGVNMSLTVCSTEMTADILITDISKVSVQN